MGIAYGATDLAAIKYGATDIAKVYKGTEEIWAPGGGGGEWPERNWIAFDNGALASGRKSYADVVFEDNGKGVGAAFYNPQYLQGYANVYYPALSLDLTQPWGVKFWFRLWPRDGGRSNQGSYLSIFTTKSSSYQRPNNSTYRNDYQLLAWDLDTTADGLLEAQRDGPDLGTTGLLTDSVWYEIIMEVRNPTSNTQAGDVHMRVDDQAGDVRLIEHPDSVSWLGTKNLSILQTATIDFCGSMDAYWDDTRAYDVVPIEYWVGS